MHVIRRVQLSTLKSSPAAGATGASSTEGRVERLKTSAQGAAELPDAISWVNDYLNSWNVKGFDLTQQRSALGAHFPQITPFKGLCSQPAIPG